LASENPNVLKTESASMPSNAQLPVLPLEMSFEILDLLAKEGLLNIHNLMRVNKAWYAM
jgi:hypothetical protein